MAVAAVGLVDDLTVPALYEDGPPLDLFDELRRTDPVAWCPSSARWDGVQMQRDGAGYWALTRYDHVVEVLRDHERFSSWAQGSQATDFPDDLLDLFRHMFINMDPPTHAKHRRIVQPSFIPRAMARMESTVQTLVDQILDSFAAAGGGDFATEVAGELALCVITDILGLPREDRHQLLEWSHRINEVGDPEYSDPLLTIKAVEELFAYATALMEDRRANPGDDLASVFAHALVDDRPMGRRDFCNMLMLLMSAGQVTVRNLLPTSMHNMLVSGEYDRLLADHALLPTAVEEMLRTTTVAMHFRRTATVDATIGGREIRAGDKVVTFLVSANHDEAVFPDATRFDAGRTPNHHIAFGAGQHFCIGAHVARLEIRSLYEGLLARGLRLESAAPPDRLVNGFINGMKHLPVAVV